MKRVVKLGLIAGIVVALSCDTGVPLGPGPDPDRNPEPDPGILQQGLWPMRVGASWSFGIDRGIGITDTRRFEVAKKIVRGTDTSYVVWIYRNGVLDDTTYQWAYSNKSDGYYNTAVFSSADTLDVSIKQFPYPAPIGTLGGELHISFQTLSIIPIDTIPRTLVSTDSLIQTPAGEYLSNAYRFHNPPPPDVSLGTDVYVLLSPNVGPVRWIITEQDNPDVVFLEASLLHYDLLE